MDTNKRIFDIVLSSIGLILLSPLMAVIAAAIKLQDGGPVFYLQKRIGMGLKPFRIIKFRTMAAGADSDGPAITSAGDPRVTRFGKVLRKLKFDEFPQLINVLKGDMSMVGPRPEVGKYVSAFLNDFGEILRVRPGITDYASIMFRDEEELLSKADDPEALYMTTVLPAKLGLNRQYVQDCCLTGDFKIIISTLIALYAAGCKRLWKSVVKLAAECNKVIVENRSVFISMFHVIAVAAANYLAFLTLFSGNIPATYRGMLPYSVIMVLILRLPLFSVFGINRGLWRYTGMSDLVRILASVTSGSTLIFIFASLAFRLNPAYIVSLIVLDWLLTVSTVSSYRLALRLYKDLSVSKKKFGKKLLLIGAGNAGEMIVRDMKKSSFDHEPVGFVDDDLSKKGLFIHGVPILGTTDDLPEIIDAYKPDEIVIAIPSAKPAMLQGLMKKLSDYKLPIQTLPNMKDILEGSVTVSHIRPLELDDLLPRPAIMRKAPKLVEFLSGKTVMVTGAGGSIGSELCRQALDLGAKAVIAYERHENSLYNLGMELKTHRFDEHFHPVVGDVNDTLRLEEVLERFRPDIIYHAAAHKHVPMMEANPREAIYNNVLGTRKVAVLANRYHVDKFVFISTDKAVNPTSIMGTTKRACELTLTALAKRSTTKFITVRFGNVLGSSGSVVPLFREQIKRGGPVTVTHPDIERYLMLIPEAVYLVLHAASIGKGGELFVLDMGEPMKIADLARNMITLSGFEPGKDIKIEYVGLRSGEKLYEELFSHDERVFPTSTDKILMAIPENSAAPAAVLGHVDQLERCILRNDHEGMLKTLSMLVTNYSHATVPIAAVPEVEQIEKAA